MEQHQENKLEFKDKLINFYNLNKVKILVFFGVLVLVFFSYSILKYKNEKNNDLIAEQYIKAGLYLSSNKKNEAKAILEKIITKKNRFYSILALNTIIEKNLISDKGKVLGYFTLVEKKINSKEQIELLTFKKALYLTKMGDFNEAEKLLIKLKNESPQYKFLAEELLIK